MHRCRFLPQDFGPRASQQSCYSSGDMCQFSGQAQFFSILRLRVKPTASLKVYDAGGGAWRLGYMYNNLNLPPLYYCSMSAVALHGSS